MKDCLTIFRLGWKHLMSLGQNEPAYLYTRGYTRLFIREAGYGDICGAKIREFESIVSAAISNVIRSPLN